MIIPHPFPNPLPNPPPPEVKHNYSVCQTYNSKISNMMKSFDKNIKKITKISKL